MMKSRYLFPLVLLASAACTKPAEQPAEAPLAPAVVAAQQDPDVKRAVEVTVALRAHPAARDSVLKAFQLTAPQFDSLKLWVSADSNRKMAFWSLARLGPRIPRAGADSSAP
ncbi:MAG TPA: hypothetical protein VL295_02965 [Gemmatimonadales bacterium]|jgi:hypothetical protein|nr:hypothetical protein [Gemmatimonadales bacterium]